MKTIISLAAVLLAAGALYSCSDDEATLPAPEEIKFEMGFADGDDLQTRAVTQPGDLTSNWYLGDRIGVYVVKGDGGLLPSGNYADNVEFTRARDENQNVTWSASAPLYWPNDGQNLSFYAYYPYDEAMTDPTAYAFNVSTEQVYAANHRGRDFIWAKLDNVAKSTSPVSLQFSHALALVQFGGIKPPGGLLATAPPMSLKEAVTDCTIDLGAQSIAAGSGRNDVRMYVASIAFSDNNKTTYWALVPPQTMDVRFAWELAGKYYTATPATGVTLAGGKVTKYQLQ